MKNEELSSKLEGFETALGNLTQKINILNGLLERHNIKIDEHDVLLKEHDEILVRGSKDKPSLQEDVRTITMFIKSLKFWISTIAVAFITQFIAVGIGLVILLLQAMPLLQKLTDK
jgi:hypothetical protein